jgi:hypothetical protein
VGIARAPAAQTASIASRQVLARPGGHAVKRATRRRALPAFADIDPIDGFRG